MSIPEITTVVPTLSEPVADDKDVGTFATRARINFLQVNPIMNAINALVAQINTASQAMNVVGDVADSAVAAANFEGEWSALTGALVVPASVAHNGDIWILTEAVADVTAHTPGVSAVWQSLGANRGGDYNIIINPEFAINQRGNVAGAVGGGYYYFDRWKTEIPTTVSVSFDDEQNTRVLTVSSGYIMQGIETARIVGEHGASGVDLVLTWEGTATGKLAFNGMEYTATGSGHVFSIPNGALATAVFVIFSGGTVSKVQLVRKKPYGIPFLRRDPEEELALCRQYCRVMTLGPSQAFPSVGVSLTTTQARFVFPLDPPMRATPGVTTSGAMEVVRAAGAVSVSSLSLQSAQCSRFGIVIDANTTSLTAGQAVYLRRTSAAGANGIITFEAEI